MTIIISTWTTSKETKKHLTLRLIPCLLPLSYLLSAIPVLPPNIRVVGDPRLPTGASPPADIERIGVWINGPWAHDFLSLLGRSQSPCIERTPFLPPFLQNSPWYRSFFFPSRLSRRSVSAPDKGDAPRVVGIRRTRRLPWSSSSAHSCLAELKKTSMRNIRYRGKKRTLIDHEQAGGQIQIQISEQSWLFDTEIKRASSGFREKHTICYHEHSSSAWVNHDTISTDVMRLPLAF